jgi:hypothetical protein
MDFITMAWGVPTETSMADTLNMAAAALAAFTALARTSFANRWPVIRASSLESLFR